MSSDRPADPGSPLPDEPAVLDEPATPFAGLEVEIGPIAYAARSLGDATLDDAIDRIETAVDCGMTLIECADVWGYDPTGADAANGGGFGAAEQRLGEVLAEVPDLRGRVVIATKGGVFPPLPFDSSADHLRQACDASLYRLGVDVIDLYQVHHPDVLTHPEEVAEVLTDLRAAGKVREVGVVGYSAWQLQSLQSLLDVPIVSAQFPFNPLRTGPLGDGVLDLAMELAITPLASSPLAGGDLCGDPGSKRAAAVAAVCDRIASEQGVRRSAVVLAWLMHHPAGVVPVIGTSRVDHIRQCAEAPDVGLSRQQWYEVLAASRGQSLWDR